MLNEKYRYVAMDFETTGLDLSKDEAIQIGIVEIDLNGNVLNQFKSYIKPQKDVSTLKNLVAYITGIDIHDVQNAPTIYDIQEEILKFFDENTIVIGHNIEFDLNFLKKYFPNVKYFDSIDTFYLAQNLIHFPLSYALDVLVESLLSNKVFSEYFLKIHDGQDYNPDAIHDGLYDSQNSLALFLYEINRMDTLFAKYPVLFNFLKKNNGLYNKILKYEVDRSGLDDQKISLPVLKKQIPSDTSLKTQLQIDLQKYQNGERYYVGNVELSQLVESIVSSNRQVIFAFSSVAKLNIVKDILNEAGIKNIGFAKGYQTIDQNKFERFLNKDVFSDNEFLFVIKYMSHVMNEGSILDLNTKTDYKINYYIQNEKKYEKYPLVLTTHGGLYSILKESDHKYKDYDICFFDTEMWYKGYNDFLSQPSDLYSILNFLETLFYKYSLDGILDGQSTIEDFARFFEIFMGVLFAETKKCFVNVQDTKITVNPILENINFYETNKLILQFPKHKAILQECINSDDFEALWSKINQFFAIIAGIVDIKKIMYNQSEFYFTYGESIKYTNRDEFKDIFTTNVYFFSDFEKSYHKLLDGSDWRPTFQIKDIFDLDRVVDFVADEYSDGDDKTCFILSTVKSESQELFDKMYGLGLGENAQLLVENITGSLGKNIFKSKKSGSKIIIGGYSFLMWLLSNKINIDICINFNTIGKMSKYLLDDIQWYAKS